MLKSNRYIKKIIHSTDYENQFFEAMVKKPVLTSVFHQFICFELHEKVIIGNFKTQVRFYKGIPNKRYHTKRHNYARFYERKQATNRRHIMIAGWNQRGGYFGKSIGIVPKVANLFKFITNRWKNYINEAKII